MKKLIYTLAVTLYASILTLSTANAAIVTVTPNFLDDAVVASGVNTGGLDNYSGATSDVGGDVIANGDDALNLQLTIDDSGDTGATFTAVMSITGLRENPDSLPMAPPGLLVSGAGHILMNGSRPDPIAFARNNDEVTFAVGSIVQTGGPVATAIFLGYSSVLVDQINNGATSTSKSFTFGSTSFAGAEGGSGGQVNVPILGATNAAGEVFDGTGADRFRFRTIDVDFDVTVVPEPGTLALGLLGIISVVAPRRR